MAVTTVIDLVVAILLIIIAVIGVILNGLVLLTAWYNRGLRTPFTIILCGICLAHILEYLLVVPLTVAEDLTPEIHGWTFGDGTCKFIKYFFYSMTYIIGFLIAFLVVDRILEAQEREFWTEEKAAIGVAVIAVLMLVVNAGIPTVYRVVEEYLDASTKRPVCSLSKSQDEEVLSTFFVFSFIVPILATVGLLAFLAHMIEVRKKFQIDHSELGEDYMLQVMIIVFSVACYGFLRFLWHVDRVVLVFVPMKYNLSHYIVQSAAEVLWYLSGILIAAYAIYHYPLFPEGVKVLCCFMDPIDEDYEEVLSLMPVVTTEADPRRYDGSAPRPLGSFARRASSRSSLRSSRTSLASSVSNLPESSQPWRIVRTLDRERSVGEVEHKEEKIRVKRERLSKSKN